MRIDELRDALHEHGEISYDEGLSARADAVRGRVRAVRRRRAGVVAACAIGAVVAVPAINALETDMPEPAGRDLAGRTAPETFVSTGFTYEFDRGVEGSASEPLRLDLPNSDEPRLVSWTVNAGNAEGRLVDRRYREEYESHPVAGGRGFETFEYVAPGDRASYQLTSTGDGEDGEMAMAVYTLSDEAPEGVTAQGVTFRDDVDGAELLGAAIGEPGESSVSFDVVLPEGDLRLSDLCSAPEKYMLHVRIEGQRGWNGSSCAGEAERDAGASSWFSVELAGRKKSDGSRFRVGETLEVTASIHREGGGGPVEVPGAIVGLGAYAGDPGEPIGVTGSTVDRRLERDGHTWSLADLDVSSPGSDSHVVLVGPVETRTYVDFGAANDPPGRNGRDLRYSPRVDGDRLYRAYQGRSGSSGPATDIQLNKGESIEIDLRAISGVDEYLSFYVASYALAD
jgi:hypothetical protein